MSEENKTAMYNVYMASQDAIIDVASQLVKEQAIRVLKEEIRQEMKNWDKENERQAKESKKLRVYQYRHMAAVEKILKNIEKHMRRK